MYKKKGFTLLEIILVAAITMIIFIATATKMYSYRQRRELNSAADLLVVYLSLAKQKAITMDGDLNWGVHLEASSTAGHFYSLFASSTYFIAGEREKIFLPKRVQFSNPAAGQSKNFIFEKNSGKITATSATSTAFYLIADPALTKTITVNAFGKIEVQ